MSSNQINPNTANFYIPVSNLDFEEIYQHIKIHKMAVAYKILDQYSKSFFIPTQADHLYIAKAFPHSYRNEKITCCFDYNGEAHLFKSFVTNEETHYRVDRPKEIYKMQRRDNYRVNIPFSLNHKFIIKQIPSLKCELRDISLGGCKISIYTLFPLEYKIGDDFDCQFEILDSETFTIRVDVVFSEYIEDKKNQIYGLKFHNPNFEMISFLQTAMVRVDRIIRGKNLE